MKRTSDHQLTKDNADDADAAAEEPQQDFERAPPEVLAKRKILKVRRTPNLHPPAAAPGPNPFAALAKAPETAPSEPVETPTANVTEKPVEKPVGPPPDIPVAKPQAPSIEKPAESTPEKTAEPAVETKSANPSEKLQEKPTETPVDKPTEPPIESSALPSDSANGTGPAKTDPVPASGLAAANPSPPTHAMDIPSDQSKPVPSLFASQSTSAPLKPAAISTNSTPKPAILFGAATKPVTFAAAAQSDGFNFKSASAAPKVEEKKQQFKEATVLTGEEKDNELFRTRAKLYTLETKDDGARWKERGVGLLKLNKNTETGKARLLMRTDATLRVVLNTPIFKGFQMDRATDRSIRFQGFDVDDQQKTTSFLARLTTKDVASQMIEAIKNCKE